MGFERHPSLLPTESCVSFSRLVVAMAQTLLGDGTILPVSRQSENVQTFRNGVGRIILI